MWNIDTLAQRCVKNSLAILDINRGTQWFDGELL